MYIISLTSWRVDLFGFAVSNTESAQTRSHFTRSQQLNDNKGETLITFFIFCWPKHTPYSTLFEQIVMESEPKQWFDLDIYIQPTHKVILGSYATTFKSRLVDIQLTVNVNISVYTPGKRWDHMRKLVWFPTKWCRLADLLIAHSSCHVCHSLLTSLTSFKTIPGIWLL